MAISVSQDNLVKIYLAAFLRAPEKSGFDYWSGFFNKGYALDDVSTTIFALSVVKEIYPTNLTSSEFVGLIYNNVFGKTADAEGLAYWAGQLDGGLTRGQLVSTMINTGLSLPDSTPGKLYIANRYRAASYAIEQQLSNGVDVNPLDLKDAMSRVTADATTIATFTNSVSALVKAATNAKGISYSSTEFIESSNNDGSIAAPITLFLTGDTFKGNMGAKLGTVANVPAGLTASLVKTSDVTADLILSGKATSHLSSASIAKLSATLADADFTSGNSKALYGVARSDIRVTYYDLYASESNGLLTLSGNLPGAVAVDLSADRLTIGSTVTRLVTGNLSAAINMDASNVLASTTTSSLSFKGDAAANTYISSPLGNSVEGQGGNDILTAGNGVDRFIFAATDIANGYDTITGFKIGKSGDILNFSAFLNKTGTTHIATRQSSETGAAAWSNGDVLVLQGYGLDAAAIAVLFGVGEPFAAPTNAAKAVVITCDIVGDAKVWFLTNQTVLTTIEPTELVQIATLVGINNLALVGFDTTNFA